MNPKTEWKTHLKEAAKNISVSYLKLRIEQTSTDDLMLDIPERKVSPKGLLKDVSEQFLRNVDEYPAAAFHTMQRRLPLLAEYLIVDSFKKKLLDRNTFSKIFRDIYLYLKIDNTIFFNVVKPIVMIKLFGYCNPEILMNIDERNHIKNLPKNVTVYRGIAGRSFRQGKAGISWTLDRDIAKRFATHNHGFFKAKSCFIIKAQVKKEDIVAYIHSSGRYEHEIIAKPSKIMDHRLYKIRPPKDSHSRPFFIT